MKKQSIFILFILSLTNNFALQADDWTGPALFAAMSGAAWTAARHNQYKEKESLEQQIIITKKETDQRNKLTALKNVRKIITPKPSANSQTATSAQTNHAPYSEQEQLAKLNQRYFVPNSFKYKTSIQPNKKLLLKETPEFQDQEYLKGSARAELNARKELAKKSEFSPFISFTDPLIKHGSVDDTHLGAKTLSKNKHLAYLDLADQKVARQRAAAADTTIQEPSSDSNSYAEQPVLEEIIDSSGIHGMPVDTSHHVDNTSQMTFDPLPKRVRKQRSPTQIAQLEQDNSTADQIVARQRAAAADTTIQEPAHHDSQVQQQQNHRSRAMITVTHNAEEFAAIQACPQAPEPSAQPVLEVKSVPTKILHHTKDSFFKLETSRPLSYAQDIENQVVTEKIDHCPNPNDWKAKTQNKNITISTERVFCPKFASSKPQHVKLIFTLHGTILPFCKHSKSFGDIAENDTSREFITYGQIQSIEHNAMVKLIPIKWDGAYSQDSRTESGRKLASLIQERIAYEQSFGNHVESEIIAHSYGGDVAREAIVNCRPHTIKRFIALASPQTSIDTSSFTQEIHMYGDYDGIATAETLLLSNGQSTNIHNRHAAYNTRTTINGDPLNHDTIKSQVLIEHLHPFLEGLDLTHDSSSLYTHITIGEEPIRLYNDDDDDAVLVEIDSVKINDSDDFKVIDMNTPTPFSIEYRPDDSHGTDHKPSYTASSIDELSGKSNIPIVLIPVLAFTVGTIEKAFNAISFLWKHQPASNSRAAHELNKQIEQEIEILTKLELEKVKQEPNFEQKQLIIGSADQTIINEIERKYGTIQDNDELAIRLFSIIKEKIQPEKNKLGAWLHKERWIIGKTVTEFAKGWDDGVKFQLEQAKIIFNRCATYNGSDDLSTFLNGYQNLDYTTQQALNSAIQQQQQFRPAETRLNTSFIPEDMRAKIPLPDTSGDGSPGASDISSADNSNLLSRLKKAVWFQNS